MARWVFPTCLKCTEGQLVPLSDFGGQGAAVHYKVWVCTKPGCGYNIKIRSGNLYVDEPILPGQSHIPNRSRSR